MKNFRLILISTILLLVFVLPVLVSAQSLVTCTGEQGEEPCTFKLFLDLIKKVVDFLIGLSAALATVVIVYAGIVLAISGGNESKRSQATNLLTTAVIGLLIVLAAYLIVQAVVLVLAGDKPIGVKLRGIFEGQ